MLIFGTAIGQHSKIGPFGVFLDVNRFSVTQLRCINQFKLYQPPLKTSNPKLLPISTFGAAQFRRFSSLFKNNWFWAVCTDNCDGVTNCHSRLLCGCVTLWNCPTKHLTTIATTYALCVAGPGPLPYTHAFTKWATLPNMPLFDLYLQKFVWNAAHRLLDERAQLK